MLNVILHLASACHIGSSVRAEPSLCVTVGQGLLPHVFHIVFIRLLYPGPCNFVDLVLLHPVCGFRLSTSCNLLDFRRDRVHC